MTLDLADTEANGIAAVHRGVALVEHLFEPRPDGLDLHSIGTSQQRRELVAAHTANHITLAKGNPQHIGEGFQGIVAFGAAIQLIDVFEVVEVEKQQGRRLA